MDVHYELNGTPFVWNDLKAKGNPGKHGGITFEQAVTVFFDPLFRLVDAERNDEARDAIAALESKLGEDEPELTRASSLIRFLEGTE